MNEATPEKLQKFQSHINKVREDVKKSWLEVPFDLPAGGYKHVIPRPNTKDEFIAVQPECQRDGKNSRIGVFNEEGKLDFEVSKNAEQAGEFSLLSFWKYETK